MHTIFNVTIYCNILTVHLKVNHSLHFKVYCYYLVERRFAAAEEAGHVERNDGRRFATVAASEASTTAA
uniref:Candidate secreted effector n=1 Tax=Meloidogyne incognita TaxID=6306 RepID=A0A914MR37_MELIC